MASDSHNITGEIHEIFDTEEIGAKRFRKREFVIKTGGQYPQLIKMQCIKDKCDLLDQFQRGDLADIGFDLRGREHNGKYYVSLEAWKMVRAREPQPHQQPRNSAPNRGFSSRPDEGDAFEQHERNRQPARDYRLKNPQPRGPGDEKDDGPDF